MQDALPTICCSEMDGVREAEKLKYIIAPVFLFSTTVRAQLVAHAAPRAHNTVVCLRLASRAVLPLPLSQQLADSPLNQTASRYGRALHSHASGAALIKFGHSSVWRSTDNLPAWSVGTPTSSTPDPQLCSTPPKT